MIRFIQGLRPLWGHSTWNKGSLKPPCQGNIRNRLKSPNRDGTTHVIVEPLDFIARLAAFVPKPRVNLTRFHRIFAPNSSLRAQMTPDQRVRQIADAGLRADVQMVNSSYAVCLYLAVSRRSSGEISVYRVNGDFRPEGDIRRFVPPKP